MSYAIVTGASKGIGKEIALLLAKKKHSLLLVARNEDALKELSEYIKKEFTVDCKWLATDLSNPDGVQKVIRFVEQKLSDVSILVNNAGYGLWGAFDETAADKQLNMMDLNMRTPVVLTHALLPLLKKQKQSYILNIASTAAYQAVPTLAVYSATKAFMVLFSRALHYELRKTNVSVTCISPGATDTNFMNAAGMTSPEILKRAEKFNMNPREVAAFALKGMFKKKNEIIPGFVNQFSVFMTRLVPKSLTEKIAAGLYE